MNSTFFVPCDPQGGASFDPQDIISINLIEVHKDIFNTKYQSSTPSSLRKEKFWNRSSLVPTCDPWGRASFGPRVIIWINLVEVQKEVLHTTYQSSKPSSFREKEFWKWASLFLCSNLWPLGWGQFWPQGHYVNKLCRGPQGDAIYHKEEEIWNFRYLFLCSNLWPLGRGQFWLQGHHINKPGRGPLEDATYQISEL